MNLAFKHSKDGYLFCRVMAVGVTKSVNMDELSRISSSSGDIIMIDDFSTLDRSLDSIVAVACPTAPPVGESVEKTL